MRNAARDCGFAHSYFINNSGRKVESRVLYIIIALECSFCVMAKDRRKNEA